MIKNSDKLKKFEQEIIEKEKTSLWKNIQLVEAMHEEALFLGIFPPKDALAGIDVDLRIAKVVNSVPKASKKNCQRPAEA
jgi:hypothetical protein